MFILTNSNCQESFLLMSRCRNHIDNHNSGKKMVLEQQCQRPQQLLPQRQQTRWPKIISFSLSDWNVVLNWLDKIGPSTILYQIFYSLTLVKEEKQVYWTMRNTKSANLQNLSRKSTLKTIFFTQDVNQCMDKSMKINFKI